MQCIAEVSVRAQFRPFFRYCLSSIAKLRRSLNIKIVSIRSSNEISWNKFYRIIVRVLRQLKFSKIRGEQHRVYNIVVKSFFFLIKILFFRPRLEYSHFSADFRLKIVVLFLNYTDVDGVEVIILSQTATNKDWHGAQNFICIEHTASTVFLFLQVL